MRPLGSEMPDPLNDSLHLPLDNVEELLSRLADQEINRMIGPNGTRYDLDPIQLEPVPEPPIASRATPVQEVTAQLDNFFDALRTRDSDAPPPESQELYAPPTAPAPIPTEHFASEDGSRRALIAPIDEPPLSFYLRLLAWLNGPVLDMSPRARVGVSVVSILSFIGSVSALVYVLTLRQG